MSAEEFALHWAAYRRRPWGEELHEVNAAMIQATITRMSGKSLRDDAAVTPADFMPWTRPQKPEADPLAFAAHINAHIDLAQGGGRGPAA